jgi:hypothetical protein
MSFVGEATKGMPTLQYCSMLRSCLASQKNVASTQLQNTASGTNFTAGLISHMAVLVMPK